MTTRFDNKNHVGPALLASKHIPEDNGVLHLTKYLFINIGEVFMYRVITGNVCTVWS